MTVSHTVSRVGKMLNISRFAVEELIQRGDLAAYSANGEMLIEPVDLELYIKKLAGNRKVVPVFRNPLPESPFDQSSGLIICGQAGVLDMLTRQLDRRKRKIRFQRHFVDSMEGLTALYNGTANLAAVHLWDGDSDEYNSPYVRRFLAGHPVLIVNFVYRMMGFYVAPGNPKMITNWADLSKPGIRFINREPGSGTRVLLDEKLRKLSIDPQSILGYGDKESTNFAVMSAVTSGKADVGLGPEQVGLQMGRVDFVPLQKERYDLVFLKQNLEKSHFRVVLSLLKSKTFQNEVASAGRYDISRIGEVMAEL